MTTVISVENLSKSYHLGQISTGTFTHDLNVWWAKIRGKPNPMLRIGETDHGNRDGEEIWALKDISFKVEQGEVLGIIGRNGAGKSTLLKILSRVTAPTLGRIKVKGRVASLLEVGTGFHPELTGRENVYLNGAILGMSRMEIDRKFDEIVDFSGVEKFIDTPVKRYSSGMYVRLAFAVAAHLDPEILLVDEVLAVGDAEFQKKCLGKMGDVAQEGRTVLFVSHNMGVLRNLCTRGVWFEMGALMLNCEINTIIDNYLNHINIQTMNSLESRADRTGNQTGKWIKVKVTRDGKEVDNIPMGSTITVSAEFNISRDIKDPVCGILIKDTGGQIILRAFTRESAVYHPIRAGINKVSCTFYELPLMHGTYSFSLYLAQPKNPIDYVDNVATIKIEQADVYGTGMLPGLTNSGLCYTKHAWDFQDGNS